MCNLINSSSSSSLQISFQEGAPGARQREALVTVDKHGDQEKEAGNSS